MESFWRESFWLPENITWKDVKVDPDSGHYYGNFRDLIYVFPTTVFLLCLRYFLENYVFFYIGLHYNIACKMPVQKVEPILESYFKEQPHPDHQAVEMLAQKRRRSVRFVERWFRKQNRSLKKQVLPMTKFKETAWRFTYYSFSLILGISVLYDKSWLYHTADCWNDYPRHNVDNGIFWYYMFSTAVYCALFISQFQDIKRKDFWEMFVHHIATVIMLTVSYTVNLIRVGTLIIIVHDFCDVLLEFSKLAKYCKFQRLCNIGFVTFALGWFITRLVMLPCWIMYSSTVEAKAIVGVWPIQIILNVFFALLIILHCIWFVMILTVLFKAIGAGNVPNDVRSSNEESEEEEDDNQSGEGSLHTPSQSGDGSQTSSARGNAPSSADKKIQ